MPLKYRQREIRRLVAKVKRYIESPKGRKAIKEGLLKAAKEAAKLSEREKVDWTDPKFWRPTDC